jgi:hypothetical protein
MLRHCCGQFQRQRLPRTDADSLGGTDRHDPTPHVVADDPEEPDSRSTSEAASRLAADALAQEPTPAIIGDDRIRMIACAVSASASATFRALARATLATALRSEGPCCTGLRRCPDCPTEPRAAAIYDRVGGAHEHGMALEQRRMSHLDRRRSRTLARDAARERFFSVSAAAVARLH